MPVCTSSQAVHDFILQYIMQLHTACIFYSSFTFSFWIFYSSALFLCLEHLFLLVTLAGDCSVPVVSKKLVMVKYQERTECTVSNASTLL